MRVMTRLLTLAALLVGCAEPLPVLVHGSTEHIDEACGILGIECTSSKRAFGSVELTIAKVCDSNDKHVAGYMEDARCIPRGCAENDPFVIAHEIGHALELEHVADDDDNLMAECPGTELDDAQLDIVFDAATRLVNCR